jgi:hypothetical protein
MKIDRNATNGRSASPEGHLFEKTTMEMGTALHQVMMTMPDQNKKAMEYGRTKKGSLLDLD